MFRQFRIFLRLPFSSNLAILSIYLDNYLFNERLWSNVSECISLSIGVLYSRGAVTNNSLTESQCHPFHNTHGVYIALSA